jgi:hypothetical protein
VRGTAGFGYRAFPKTGFFGEIYYGQTVTTPNFPAPNVPHVNFIGSFIGARGSFTDKISGVVKAGYESREFSDNSSAPGSPVVDLSLNYAMSAKRSVLLSYARLHDVSVQFARESYTADAVTLRLGQTFGPAGKWNVSIGGSYGTYAYEQVGGATGRQYDRYSGNINLAYQIQLWLSANLGYNFDAIRSGGGGVADYDINRVGLSLAVGY